MRIFVFEFITGGGWFAVDPDNPPTGSLLCEGRTMVEAVAQDFAAIRGVSVSTIVDARLNHEAPLGQQRVEVRGADDLDDAITHLAREADFTLLIAPEFDGHLLRSADAVARAGGQLLGPSAEFIRLASDKQVTAQRLYEHSIQVPRGISLSAGQSLPVDFRYPAVVKPRHGAGSLDVRLLAHANAARELAPCPNASRLEMYHPGTPVSVAALYGRHGPVFLPPCSQSVSGDGRFTYQGGACPLPKPLADRAIRLARKTFAALPPAVGYVGIDLVLGDEERGPGDVVIEVNPRLTTSYVGLRALVRENLADAMLRVARGERVELSIKPGRVEFSAGGEVQFHSE